MAQWAKMFNNLLELEWEEGKEKSRRYVQRDLEDQIEEEYIKRGKQYQRTQKQEKMEIRTKDVAKLLKEGYTRYKKDDKGFGSIQEKYGLTALEVIEVFTTPSLKYMKTILPKVGLQIVDDLNEETSAISPEVTSSTGTITCVPYTGDIRPSAAVPGVDLVGDIAEAPRADRAEATVETQTTTPVNKDELFS